MHTATLIWQIHFMLHKNLLYLAGVKRVNLWGCISVWHSDLQNLRASLVLKIDYFLLGLRIWSRMSFKVIKLSFYSQGLALLGEKQPTPSGWSIRCDAERCRFFCAHQHNTGQTQNIQVYIGEGYELWRPFPLKQNFRTQRVASVSKWLAVIAGWD